MCVKVKTFLVKYKFLYILSYITDYFINFVVQYVRINVDLLEIFIGINVVYCQTFL